MLVSTIFDTIEAAKIKRKLTNSTKTLLSTLRNQYAHTNATLADVELSALEELHALFAQHIVPKMPASESLAQEIHRAIVCRQTDLEAAYSTTYVQGLVDLVVEHCKGIANMGSALTTMYRMAAEHGGTPVVDMRSDDVNVIHAVINRAGSAVRKAFIERLADANLTSLAVLYPTEYKERVMASDSLAVARYAVLKELANIELTFKQRLCRAAGNSATFLRASMVLNHAIRTHTMSEQELRDTPAVDINWLTKLRRICHSTIVNAAHTEYDRIMDNKAVILFLARRNVALPEVTEQISAIANIDASVLRQMQEMDNKIRAHNVQMHFKTIYDAVELADATALADDVDVESLSAQEVHALGIAFIRACKKVRIKTIEHAIQRNSLANLGDITMADDLAQGLAELVKNLEFELIIANHTLTATVASVA